MVRKRQTWVVLILALGCGAAAAVLAAGYVQRIPVIAPAPTREVAVAVTDLPIGTLLKPEHVRLVRWPEDALPPGYHATAAAVVGRGLTTPVRANEPLMDGKLAGQGEGGGLPPLIPDGMRALSVSVNQVVAVAGFVIPGTRVDVLLTIEKDGEPQTRVFMQNRTVLASNQSIVHDEEGKPMTVSIVTLLVDPQQAEALTLATQEGRLQLVLRNRVDVDEVRTRGARLVDLGGSRAREPAARREVSVREAATETNTRSGETVVETFRGGVRTLSTFSQGTAP